MNNNVPLLQDAASALLGWVAAMGVDTLVGATPHNYFSPPPPAATRPVTSPPRIITAPPLPQEEQQHARSLAAQAKEVESLLQLMQDTDICPLKRTALRGVQGWGNPHAPLFIIGDMPDIEDESAGQYCSGLAGVLLENMLRAINFSKDACYALPLVWWRPPGGRQASTSEIATCIPFIERFITLQRPKALLITGGIAASTLLKAQGSLQQLRSKTWEYNQGEAAKTIPAFISFSPFHLLRQPSLKQPAWQDWLQIKSLLNVL